MRLQELYRLHLLRGHGARVRVRFRPPHDGVCLSGSWQVGEGGVFLIDEAADPGPVEGGAAREAAAAAAAPVGQLGGFADLWVELETGVHCFQGFVKPLGPRRWQVFPAGLIAVEQRRDSIRVPARLELRVGYAGDDRRWAGVTRDLSASGLGFVSDAPLQVGDLVELELEGVLGQALGRLRARVVRASAAPDAGPEAGMAAADAANAGDAGIGAAGVARRFGARFVDLDNDGVLRLARVVWQLRQRAERPG